MEWGFNWDWVCLLVSYGFRLIVDLENFVWKRKVRWVILLVSLGVIVWLVVFIEFYIS